MNPSAGLRAVFLGSGSAGNCTAITSGDTVVLIDCGLSARETARRLIAADIDPAAVAAILVTHEHGDHVRGIDVFVRRYAPDCVVHASQGTVRAALPSSLGDSAVPIRPGDEFHVGELDIVAFSTSHDAADPVGYRVASGLESVGIATDTGVLTPQAAEALSGVTILGIEGNHDVEMLERGPYPYHLKRRIMSARGHLSNADAAHAVELLAGDGLQRVVTLHRSRTNNTAALAGSALRERLRQMGLTTPVEVVEQDGSSEIS
jgi:phosphoribosyl 1,2-cyclic phosphodiesterase